MYHFFIYFINISIKDKTEKRRKNSIGTAWDGGTAKTLLKKKFEKFNFQRPLFEILNSKIFF